MSVTDRKSALRYLKAVADVIPVEGGFFSFRGPRVERSWQVSAEVKLTVIRRSYSQAEPTNISYQIDLGSLMPPPAEDETTKDYLTVYVLRPKDDIVANRVAYQRCLDDLIANEASFSSQKPA
ncbi:hypothetical protein GSI_02592 [Ganoderma sinense ZZ0214-1]|uniref:Uncharacterized protein n=1 Tax=Ganoderma sinense ZZ0214-1 TaxID=1077348 RepID=A0A2G8SM03_9APHY|nr:hypothetical protein GSI_02592 [Ganoderma sinense ZZ0214-1]